MGVFFFLLLLFVAEMASQHNSSGVQRIRKKTIHYLVQTAVVEIVHSAVIQRQKCAVNAGKQRN